MGAKRPGLRKEPKRLGGNEQGWGKRLGAKRLDTLGKG